MVTPYSLNLSLCLHRKCVLWIHNRNQKCTVGRVSVIITDCWHSAKHGFIFKSLKHTLFLLLSLNGCEEIIVQNLNFYI